jgi:microcystin-dependent protein
MSGPISGVTPLFQGTATTANTANTAVNVSGTVAVGNGGTGVTTLATNNVLLGNGTSTLQTVAPGTSGNVLTSNGSTWQSVSALPSGTITMWPTGTPPTGWLLADGSAVSRVTYATLFTVITTTFGIGDGVSTFNLPNYTDRMPIGAGSTYAVAATGGSKDAVVVTHSHTASSSSSSSFTGSPLADHAHTVGGPNSGGGSGISFGNAAEAPISISTSSVSGGTPSGSVSTSTSTTVNSTGSSGTNANLPPYLGIRFIIKT